MAYSPIAFTAPNYRDYKNEWLKAYEPGTTTPKAMALDSGGVTQVAKLQLNAGGFLVSAGDALVIPYIDGNYDLWLFPTEDEADTNDTNNAIRLADDINSLNTSIINDLSQAYTFKTVALMQASSIVFPIGKKIVWQGYYAESDGGSNWGIVTSGAHTDDGGSVFTLADGQHVESNLKSQKINVKKFGAKGNGIQTENDTASYQNTANFILSRGATKGGVIYTPQGTFYIDNLTVYDYITIEGESRDSSRIYATSTGVDAHYLIKTSKYETGNSANTQVEFRNIEVHAQGNRENAIIMRAFGSTVEKTYIRGATDTDLLVPTQARDGTDIGFTMVNNVIINNWIGKDAGTAKKNFWLKDNQNKATDMTFTGNYVSSASEVNIRIETLAGTEVSGNHIYGGAVNAIFLRGGLGTRISDNYFEGDWSVNNMLAFDTAWEIGPGNYTVGDVSIDFGNDGTNIQSKGNTYKSTVLHNFFAANKVFTSSSDTYTLANPFLFSSGGSTGTIKTKNCYIVPLNKWISSQFIGTKSSWDRDTANEYGNINVYSENATVTGGGVMTKTIKVPTVEGTTAGHSLKVLIGTRRFTVNEPKQEYSIEGVIFADGGTNIKWTPISEVLDSGQFTVDPVINITDNADGTMDIDVVWTPIDSLGSGGISITYA